MVCRELGAKIKSIYVNGHCMSNFSCSTLLASPLCLCQNMGLLERGTKVNDLFDGLSIITAIREIPKLFLTSIETVSWTICFFSLPDAAICQFPVKKMGFCEKPPKVFFFLFFFFSFVIESPQKSDWKHILPLLQNNFWHLVISILISSDLCCCLFYEVSTSLGNTAIEVPFPRL